MRKIRVLIVEDSSVVRTLLEEIVSGDPRLEVAASVASAEEALRLLARTAPDVISLDIRLPGMNGLDATRRIMAERPTPIVVVSASVEKEDLKISINALSAGALSIVEKPVGVRHADYRETAEGLCTQLAIMSQVKVIRQRSPAVAAFASRRAAPRSSGGAVYSMLGLAASTGGPNALEKVLGALPADFSLPILVVQHIASGFLEGFAAWLSTACKRPATIAQDGLAPVPGHVYLAPAERHLTIRSGRLALDPGPAVLSQRPSGNVLFDSMAHELGPRALGALLTGMGEDGAAGLLQIRRAGGFTIAEDESTAVVYGMPQAAARLGAACESLPLHDIAPRIMELVS